MKETTREELESEIKHLKSELVSALDYTSELVRLNEIKNTRIEILIASGKLDKNDHNLAIKLVGGI